MSNNIEDDEKAALAGISSAPPPPRKIHSHSQQLAPSSGDKRNNQVRKHSFDGNCKTTPDANYADSSDDDFNLESSTAGSTAVANEEATGEEVVVQQTGDDFQPLAEFIGSGGGAGIFKFPVRAAVHPGRPTCLELRPHPLRETQGGRFLRNIVCTETQLWAGQENGVRFWNFEDAYELGAGVNGKAKRGDEDAAPFQESANSYPTTCLLVDGGNRLVWSGHKDGKIRSWKMDQPAEDTPFKEGLSWQAHRGPVNSIVISFYGDMWSCSEGGVIKIWPWEAMEKPLSLKAEEKHMAAVLVERAGIDLRSQNTVNGTCSISSSDIKHLMSDNIGAKIWAVQPLSFSLWDARTKELLKVFNIDGQIENRIDPSAQDQGEDGKVPTKKEKPQSFLQRSRNAILGAADAVRRVATRGAFTEEVKRTETIVLASDGKIWTGCTNGLLVMWDGNGNRLQDVNHHHRAVLCFCTVGQRMYVGYVSGYIQVMDLEGHLIAGWVSHSNPVIKLAAGGGYVFSLATHGGIRGWNIASPGPLDSIIKSELAEKGSTYRRRDNVRVLIGTWNVGQGRASHGALMSWLGSVSSDVGIIVVGLQEVEMGAGFLAMSAAKETVGLEGSPNGQLWLDIIGKALDEKTTFERMGSRQLASLLIALWVRKNHRTNIGDIDVGAVPCGFGRAIGNKGGVGLRIRVYDRTMCFINCHLAAHLEAVARRNADFDHIYRSMVFTRSNLLSAAAAGVSTSVHVVKSTNNQNIIISTEEAKLDLGEADMVVFFGDFNYRLFGITYDEARDLVSQRSFDWLREKDQLRAEMKAGRVFQGMREAIIAFPPTYKFEKHKAGLAGYDSGEKKRIPAWCDRVLFRDNRQDPLAECSLECPTVASVILYEACMDVTESDHKPVRCKFHVKIAHVDRSIRRQEFGKIMKSNEKVKTILDELRYVPETTVSTDNIFLQNQDTAILKITNQCVKEKATYKIICEGQTFVKDDEEASDFRLRSSFGFPRWLEVTPAAGVITPNSFVEVSVHHEEFHTLEENVDGIHQSWWCEDTRDKILILVVNVQGSCSSETVSHRIHVRHCFSARTVRDAKVDSSNADSLKNNPGGTNHSCGEDR